MPTPTGLPKPGEIWERTIRLPITGKPGKWDTTVTRFVVLERTAGQNWSLRVHARGDRQPKRWWTDVSYGFSKGEFRYIGQAGPETRKRLGL